MPSSIPPDYLKNLAAAGKEASSSKVSSPLFQPSYLLHYSRLAKYKDIIIKAINENNWGTFRNEIAVDQINILIYSNKKNLIVFLKNLYNILANALNDHKIGNKYFEGMAKKKEDILKSLTAEQKNEDDDFKLELKPEIYDHDILKYLKKLIEKNDTKYFGKIFINNKEELVTSSTADRGKTGIRKTSYSLVKYKCLKLFDNINIFKKYLKWYLEKYNTYDLKDNHILENINELIAYSKDKRFENFDDNFWVKLEGNVSFEESNINKFYYDYLMLLKGRSNDINHERTLYKLIFDNNFVLFRNFIESTDFDNEKLNAIKQEISQFKNFPARFRDQSLWKFINQNYEIYKAFLIAGKKIGNPIEFKTSKKTVTQKNGQQENAIQTNNISKPQLEEKKTEVKNKFKTLDKNEFPPVTDGNCGVETIRQVMVSEGVNIDLKEIRENILILIRECFYLNNINQNKDIPKDFPRIKIALKTIFQDIDNLKNFVKWSNIQRVQDHFKKKYDNKFNEFKIYLSDLVKSRFNKENENKTEINEEKIKKLNSDLDLIDNFKDFSDIKFFNWLYFIDFVKNEDTEKQIKIIEEIKDISDFELLTDELCQDILNLITGIDTDCILDTLKLEPGRDKIKHYEENFVDTKIWLTYAELIAYMLYLGYYFKGFLGGKVDDSKEDKAILIFEKYTANETEVVQKFIANNSNYNERIGFKDIKGTHWEYVEPL